MNEYYPKAGRVILHVDMNSFYASVEMAYNPELKGKPIAVAGNPDERKGIIITCSYEAREYGIKTTMPLWEAKKLCPHLMVMGPNFDRYRDASKGMFDILRSFTHLVEPVSIDEGYMDITDCFELGTPIFIAETIQNRILQQLDLPCSIGIAPNKFLAKTASDMKKPLGITILRKREVSSILWPKDVLSMHGVGSKTAEKLNNIHIYTIGDLANANEFSLKTLLGINGPRLKERANGIDERPVDPDSIYVYKTIGNSRTLPRDVTNQRQLLEVLEGLSDKVATRLKNKRVMANQLSITIRYNNWKTITRSKKQTRVLYKKEEIYQSAKELFLAHWTGNPVRLLGITTSDLVDKTEAIAQLDLFSYENEAKKEPLYQAVEALQKKFGKAMIQKGIAVQPAAYEQKEDTSFNKDFLRENQDNGKDTE
ncbi:DNA polymerase IV [Bacillus coahuilensis m2-6]|uniref:DNA polymerase IV n=1 Tax=Bacillus coahuilensis TaxID=408580 RepID=UPI000750310F|nr:DNA polymerase IV [Bacillus coahuilensis]KUP07481.1 DNA polymerase IV [Bacillus coahuilensis m2-6]